MRKIHALSITPVFGKAINENVIVGASIGYAFVSNRDANANSFTNSSKTYTANIFIRKYYQIKKSDFYLVMQGSFGASSDKFETRNGGEALYTVDKTSGISLNLSPGLAYAISRKFHVEMGLGQLASLGYQHSLTKNYIPTYSKSTGNGFSFYSTLSSGIQAYIGFRILLARS